MNRGKTLLITSWILFW